MAKKTETKDKCKICTEMAGSDDWLACEICDGWFHASCVKVNDEALPVV